ncbi:MAG TPA: D-glycerate dehydrogenase [Burkholderiales bacterium]|nr:D-glycerate dehydrogenase [Burkholderiales bacterium]
MTLKVLVSRRTFDPVVEDLRAHFEVEDRQNEDRPLDADGMRARLAGKTGALIFPGEPIDAATLDAAPGLKVLALAAVGYNSVDIEACTARGILVTNTPGVLDQTTADMAWALMLAAARRVTEAERWLRAGKWTGMNFGELWGTDVHHATLGILGMGRIGRAIAKRASGFDMKVIYHNRTRPEPGLEAAAKASYVSFDELLRRSDFLCLVLPYTPENHHIIGADQLERMKPSAILVNIARGGIADDAALVEALKAKRIAGAGLDVYEGEPKFNPGFLGLDNVVLAPHLGSATHATRLAMARLAATNLIEALTGGKPPTPVNPEVLV